MLLLKVPLMALSGHQQLLWFDGCGLQASLMAREFTRQMRNQSAAAKEAECCARLSVVLPPETLGPFDDKVTQCAGAVCWCSVVVQCGGAVLWCSVLVQCGECSVVSAVWWCSVVVQCAGAGWWCSLLVAVTGAFGRFQQSVLQSVDPA